MSKWLQNLIIITSLLLVGCNTPVLSGAPKNADINLDIFEITSDIVEVQTISGGLQEVFDVSRLSITERRARQAAVKVRSLLKSGHGSGTYIIAHGRRVVVTAAHVVRNESVMAIDGRDGETVVGKVVFTDPENDIAFITVPEIKTRTAVRYKPQRRYDERLMGTNITYTGFPSHHDLLTIRGYVAALEHRMLVTNMFGWFGSSGSGVFDQSDLYLDQYIAAKYRRFTGGLYFEQRRIDRSTPLGKIGFPVTGIGFILRGAIDKRGRAEARFSYVSFTAGELQIQGLDGRSSLDSGRSIRIAGHYRFASHWRVRAEYANTTVQFEPIAPTFGFYDHRQSLLSVGLVVTF